MSRPKYVKGYKAAFVLVESLLALMEERGVCRADLAKLAEVERSTVTKWLAPGRNLTIFTAATIADLLDADLDIAVRPRAHHSRPDSRAGAKFNGAIAIALADFSAARYRPGHELNRRRRPSRRHPCQDGRA